MTNELTNVKIVTMIFALSAVLSVWAVANVSFWTWLVGLGGWSLVGAAASGIVIPLYAFAAIKDRKARK